jgi:hypothetical protein
MVAGRSVSVRSWNQLALAIPRAGHQTVIGVNLAGSPPSLTRSFVSFLTMIALIALRRRFLVGIAWSQCLQD